ncbi:hypothetical protein HUA78_36045 [Myxococcus sp. CA033]|uniref:hypothetical protein n=1 Tax=Myxococcus sp. CA033 TaxID=2741516 RepID=UPI00157BB4A0|nr:hypothetical protein [Myxococcus sp. CA033]NTX39864.1 hypothetical protein [Myxococcus sp. CA033]
MVAALCDQAVRFLVIGGLAVRHYAPIRIARDLDLLIDATPSNAQRVFRSFAQLSLTPLGPIEQLTRPTQQVHINTAEFLVDLVTPNPDTDFEVEWQNASHARIGFHKARVIARPSLIRLKTGTGRPKDIEDITLLMTQSH